MGLFGRDDRRPPEPSSAAPITGTSAPLGSAQAMPEATTIARGCNIEGTIKASGDIMVQGAFDGEIRGAARLIIAESGKVKAQLRARSVSVAGTVEGDVFAQEKIELKPSANLLGNMTAPKILIQEGATFEGQVFMKDPGSDGPSAGGSKASKDTRPIPSEVKGGPGSKPVTDSSTSSKAEAKTESKADDRVDAKVDSKADPKSDASSSGSKGSKS